MLFLKETKGNGGRQAKAIKIKINNSKVFNLYLYFVIFIYATATQCPIAGLAIDPKKIQKEVRLQNNFC